MPKLVDFEKKKREIAHKALFVFAYEGFHKTTLAQIAELCQIGRTTIYQYFENKDEIFSYSLNYSFDLIRLDLRQVLDLPGMSSLEAIREIVRRVLGAFYEERRVLLLLLEHSLRIIREDRSLAGRIREQVNEIEEMFARLLERGVGNGELRPVQTVTVAVLLQSLLLAVILRFAADESLGLEQALAGVDELLAGLRRQPGEVQAGLRGKGKTA
jgi:AcrR family transcriptional regulator